MSATLKDIAKDLGVSINTVSRALRDKLDISQNMKNQVNEAAARLGYRKNMAASQLRSNQSHIVGVVVTDIGNPVFSAMIKGIENVCKQTNYTIMVGNSNENGAEEVKIVSSMLDHGVDGILLVPSMKDAKVLTLLQDSETPFVVLQRKFPKKELNYVQSNDFEGGCAAAEHLWRKGHRSFLYVSAPMVISSSQDRYEGFLTLLRRKGLPDSAVQTLVCDGTKSGSYEAASKWLEERAPSQRLDMTAIFCFSDYVACGVYSALSRFGLRIPEDISIIGYDNNEYCDIMSPPLTTVDIRPFQTGRQACNLLIEIIEASAGKNPVPPSNITISPMLISRSSTAEVASQPREVGRPV